MFEFSKEIELSTDHTSLGNVMLRVEKALFNAHGVSVGVQDTYADTSYKVAAIDSNFADLFMLAEDKWYLLDESTVSTGHIS